ncbi:Uncharacterised protein [Acinetobacter baumannii]|nr:Uncharacterised protein [Acinetobacter baumannii]
MFFAAQRVHHRRLQQFGQLDHFIVRAGAAAAAHQGDVLRLVQRFRQLVQLAHRRLHQRQRRGMPGHGRIFRRHAQRHVARQDDHRYAAIEDRLAHGDLQHARQLFRVGDQFAIVAAFAEQLLRMGFLEVAAADFAGRDVRGDRQHRHMVAVAVEQAVDQMQVAGAAGTGAHRQLAGELGFGAGGEGGHLFMAGAQPSDGAHAVQAVAEAVERIAGHAPNAFYAGLIQRFGDQCGYGLLHGSPKHGLKNDVDSIR